MQESYSTFMSWLSKREWVKALLMASAGAIIGYFAEIYNDLDFTNFQTFVNFDFIGAAIDAFHDWKTIVNKIIFAAGTYIFVTFFRNSDGKYFKRETK